jgi:hypothetical protein
MLGGRRNTMNKRLKLLVFVFFLITCQITNADWELYERTNVKGQISGMIKKDRVIEMQSGSIYQVSGLTLQLVLELAPEAIVLSNGTEFKVVIDGFDEPLICKQLKSPINLTLDEKKNYKSTDQTEAQDDPNISLDKLIPKEKQQEMGLHKLTKQEQYQLRQFLIRLYLLGYENGRKENSMNVPTKSDTTNATAIESQIDGDFEGWQGETVVKLMNGQIWKQTDYYYHYHYAFMPRVLVYKSGAGYKMIVDGIDKPVGVIQLK